MFRIIHIIYIHRSCLQVFEYVREPVCIHLPFHPPLWPLSPFSEKPNQRLVGQILVFAGWKKRDRIKRQRGERLIPRRTIATLHWVRIYGH